MKYIEFAINTNLQYFQPSILLIECENISSIQRIEKNNYFCKILTRQGLEYYAFGNYKTLTNRLFYTLSKKHSFYEDDIIRPSIRVYHRNLNLEPDAAFLDPIQLKAFIYGIDENFSDEKLPEYTKEIFSKLNYLNNT